MTRFARSKGSKASNERVPEQATSWSDMKKQLVAKSQEVEDAKKRKEVLKQRDDSYKAFLEEVEEEKSKNTEWSEFPESKSLENDGKKKKFKNGAPKEAVKATKGQGKIMKKEIKKKGAKIKTQSASIVQLKNEDDAPLECSSKMEQPEIEVGKKKPKKKKLKIIVDTETAESSKKQKVEAMKESFKVESPKKEHPRRDLSALSERDRRKVELKIKKKLRQLETKKLNKQLRKQENEMNGAATQKPSQSRTPIPKFTNKPQEHVKDRSKFKRSKEMKPDRKTQQQNSIVIDGKIIDLVYVDGFPIRKEDADRIAQLRKQMISKGLPRSEISAALKLERRRAEKALVREKKKVCFNCRKSGHVLSECPEIGKEELVQTTASGICFKCGSTEHTHFECKVVRGQEFKFAKCFICHEQGHIAKQCPDNARGLYPKGGACNVCGDVTHLKKDCPQFQAQKKTEEDKLQVGTINSGNPELLEDGGEAKNAIKKKKSKNKIIKF